jgi:glyoxylase I family protein
MAVKYHFAHIALTCDDPIAIERWYTKHFGFTRARVYDPGPGQVVQIQSGPLGLELFKSSEQRPVEKPAKDGAEYSAIRHFAFVVDDLDAKLAEIGGDTTVTLGPIAMDKYIDGMRVAWISDPEGNIIELNQGYVDQESPEPLA